MKHWIVCCASFAVLGPVSAVASPVTFAFSGQLTQVASLDPQNPFPDAIDFGTPFSGAFTFDSVAPDLVPLDPATGSYTSSGGPFGMSLKLGGLSFAFASVNIGVLDDYSGVYDAYLVTFFEDATSGNPTGIGLELTFIDTTMTAFSSDGLPRLAPPIGNFQIRDFFFTDTIQDNQVEVAGTVDAMRTVPEPSSLLLLTAPVAWFARQRFSRRRG